MSEVIKMPHLGENASISVDYVEPTVGELEELDDLIGKPGATVRKLCSITILVDGAKKPTGWWQDLPEGPFIKIRDYMISNRPKAENSDRPLESGS